MNIKVTTKSGRLKSTNKLLSKQTLFKVYVFITTARKKIMGVKMVLFYNFPKLYMEVKSII